MAFTTFAFDGLKRKRRSGSKRRASRSLGRIKRGAKRSMEKVCGCKLSTVRAKGGRRQPVLVCPGTPMRRFVSKADAARMHGKSVCTTVLKPLR